MINLLGSVQVDKPPLFSHPLCPLALYNDDKDAFCGISHHDATVNNPFCKECWTPAGLKVFMYTHMNFTITTGSCPNGLQV